MSRSDSDDDRFHRRNGRGARMRLRFSPQEMDQIVQAAQRSGVHDGTDLPHFLHRLVMTSIHEINGKF